MAARKYIIIDSDQNRSKLIKWEGLLNTDTGDVYEFTHFADRTVQVTGTFDGAVTIQGSNDGTNYATLNDVFGIPLSFTAAGLRAIAECPKYVKPVVAAGTTALNAVNIFSNGERA